MSDEELQGISSKSWRALRYWESWGRRKCSGFLPCMDSRCSPDEPGSRVTSPHVASTSGETSRTSSQLNGCFRQELPGAIGLFPVWWCPFGKQQKWEEKGSESDVASCCEYWYEPGPILFIPESQELRGHQAVWKQPGNQQGKSVCVVPQLPQIFAHGPLRLCMYVSVTGRARNGAGGLDQTSWKLANIFRDSKTPLEFARCLHWEERLFPVISV